VIKEKHKNIHATADLKKIYRMPHIPGTMLGTWGIINE
jgi:hypothetical protein